MSVWLFLLSIGFALVSSTPVECSMYECKQAGQVFPLDACVQELDNIYYATPCPSGQSSYGLQETLLVQL